MSVSTLNAADNRDALGPNETWFGAWENVANASALIVTASSDVAGSLWIDFSEDGIAQRSSRRLTAGTTGDFGTVVVDVENQFARVRVVNGATAQSSLAVQMILAHGVGPILPQRDIHHQNMRGWNFQTAFGRRLMIPTNTTADVWPGAAATRPLPTGPTTMAITSSSASDQYGASGAQFVGVSFIDDQGDWRMSDLIPVLGTSLSTITYQPNATLNTDGGTFTVPGGDSIAAPIYRIQDMAVVVALGATEAAPRVNNIGSISAVDQATGTVQYDVIAAGRGRSASCAFHCPRNYRGHITYVPVGSSEGRGEFAAAITVGPGTAWQLVPLTTVNSSAALFQGDPVCTPIFPQADVQVIVSVGSNNINALSILQVRLEPYR